MCESERSRKKQQKSLEHSSGGGWGNLIQGEKKSISNQRTTEEITVTEYKQWSLKGWGSGPEFWTLYC